MNIGALLFKLIIKTGTGSSFIMRLIHAILVALRLFDIDLSFLSSNRTKALAKLFLVYGPTHRRFLFLNLFTYRPQFTGSSRYLLMISFLFSMTTLVNGQSSQTFNTAGNYTLTPPAGVTSISVQAWGGGGCSGQNTSGRARGGGGGGAYSEGIISVTPGVPLTIVVGAGGVYNNNNTATDDGGDSSVGILVANGGSRGVIGNNVALNGGPGGMASTNPGGVFSFISYAGGKGGNGYVAGDNGGGGGGGASASSAGTGNAGDNGTSGGEGGAGGIGNAGEGDGGRGSDNDGSPNSTNGIFPGGGGGGRGDYNGNNTNGAAGQVIISWSIPTGYCTGNAITVFSQSGVNNPNNATGAPDNIFATLNDYTDQLTLTLGDLLTSSGTIDARWRRNGSTSSNPQVSVDISTNGTNWATVNSYTVSSLTWVTQIIPLSIDTRFVRFTENNSYDLDIDAISYNTPCGITCMPPTIFSVTGGGNYCTSGGMPVGLTGSETGVEYQLFLGTTSLGSPLPGTGMSLDFGSQIAAGTYTVLATRIVEGCTATMNGIAEISVSIPAQPTVITGSTISCIGSSQTYSVTNVPGVTYDWVYPSGWIQTSGGTTSSVIVKAGANAGDIIVTPSNSCGTGIARNLTVTTTATMPSQPGTINGPAAPCNSTNLLTYSVPNVPGLNYAWAFPAGWSITAGQGTNSVSVLAGSTAGTVTVTASNSCGTSASQTLAVTIGSPPKPTISANYCYGGGYIQLTANGGGNGASYLWSTDETTSSILVNIAGQYSADIITAGGCTASASYSISTELVVNGDFSSGNTGFTHSTYIYEPDISGNSELVPEGRYGVGTNPNTYHSNFWGRDHTTGTGNFMIVNGFPGSPQPVIWANTVAVVPGVAYYFSAWALSLNTAGNYANLQFRVNNTLVGTTAPLPARPQNNNPPYNWIQFYGTWTAPAGVFSVPIEIVDLQTAAAGNDFGLDDISFATLAPLPAVIAPTTNASNGNALCPGQTLYLYANLTGGKAPFTFAWTGPAGFTSTLANPSISNVTLANAGIYTLTITDGYGCAPVTASTLPAEINPFPTCSITGTTPLCPSGTGTYTAPAGMATYVWTITGNGSIQGLTNGQSVNVIASAMNNSQFTLSLAITDANGCSSNCQQVFSVADIVPPTFTLPLLNTSYCVESVSDALYNPGHENTNLDITYIRPDYYLFPKGSMLLNLSTVADNCALAASPVSWTIDFGNNGSIDLSGIGELSMYSADIQFPLGTNRISFTVTDAVGNTSVQVVDLSVNPRPVITNNF